ncbi:hypothetical protein [Acidovorax sp. NCPPB 3576]|uniref:hypothetical protein n=1 Tax=Acidovorax sp. NCPPB 3576 TaxID=2940488 RepID=UPI00234B92E7|nr:hypothetical protein [Acidovorax sp. NCPPB 3576]WCM88715.1 hypothetical protein M5C98_01225 [Acidovorax sp. NCPPB 3576]
MERGFGQVGGSVEAGRRAPGGAGLHCRTTRAMGARSHIARKAASQQFPDCTNGYFFCLNFGFPALLTSNATTTTTMSKNA